MMRYLHLFFWGMLISFLGSLPLGAMNIVATEIAVSRGIGPAFGYSLGSLLVEIACVRIVLILMERIYLHRRLFRILEWVTACVLLLLSAASIIAAIRMTGFHSSLPVFSGQPFLSGVFISALNPLHFVFWIAWSTVLINKKVLWPGAASYSIYLAGISLGTLGGFAAYIYGGNYLVETLKDDQDRINWCVGAILGIMAVVQLYRLRSGRKPGLTPI